MASQRVLIIGVGSIGERHLRCMQRLPRTEIAICDLNAELRHTITERYGIRDVFVDFHTALSAGATAAVICVPAHLHVPIATQLVEAGIHVLIEKPLSTSFDGVDRLRAAVNRRGVVAAVAYVQRANPILVAMRQALLSGRFGRPLQIVAISGQQFPFYRPAYRETYYKDRATGGGAIQDALTHIVNSAEWLVGPMCRAVADAAHCAVPEVNVEDTVHVLARHSNVLASYSLNQHQAPNEITITVMCERGTLRSEFHENRWRWMIEPGNKWNDEPGPVYERDDLFAAQLAAFFDAIEYGTPPLCTLDEGIQTLYASDAILRSCEAGQWIQTTLR